MDKLFINMVIISAIIIHQIGIVYKGLRSNYYNNMDNINNINPNQTPQKQNIIFIKTLSSGILKTDITNIDKIIDLKHKISVQHKIPIDMCILMMHGCELDDNITLGEYQIVAGCSIILKLNLRGD